MRSKELEIIDLGPSHYTLSEYNEALEQLDRVGRWLGGNRASLKALQVIPEINHLLDVGCGGGHFTLAMAKKYPKAAVLGVDVNPLAIDFANRELTHPPNLSFQLLPFPKLDYPPKSFDVVIATLVCHHMEDAEIVEFLKQASRIAKKQVIINDLHRHRLALLGFNILSPIFFPNRLVRNDGPLSIKRSFVKKDLEGYLEEAGIKNYSLTWRLPFRWVLQINCEEL